MLCARRRIPFVFFAWQNIRKRIPPPFALLRGAVFTRATGGIAGSPRAGEVLRAWGYRGPLAVIPQMGVDPERFAPDPAARNRVRERLGIADATPLVGYVGRLAPEKGVDLLIDAVASVPESVLIVVGGGPREEALRRRAQDAGVAQRVRFAGSVPSASIPEWMSALDVLALPSLTTPTWAEQFGRVLVEAMATGVAVVGSDSGEIPWVIGDAGVIVPEGDGSALASALASLCGSAERRRSLGARGRAAALERFGAQRIVDDTVRFYRELLGTARPSARPVGAGA